MHIFALTLLRRLACFIMWLKPCKRSSCPPFSLSLSLSLLSLLEPPSSPTLATPCPPPIPLSARKRPRIRRHAHICTHEQVDAQLFSPQAVATLVNSYTRVLVPNELGQVDAVVERLLRRMVVVIQVLCAAVYLNAHVQHKRIRSLSHSLLRH